MGCVYRSPGTSNDDNNAKLCQLINAACSRKSSHLLIMGDFNYPEINWDTITSRSGANHPSWSLLDCLQDNFLFQLVDFNTRYREGQQPSLLDLVITNEDGMIKELNSRNPLGKSDHAVISFTLTCYLEADDDNQHERYMYNKGNYDKMREELKTVNWETVLENEDANNSWNIFANKLKEAMDSNVPKSKPKLETNNKPRKPLWMSKDAMTKVKKKYHAWKRYTGTRQYQDYQHYCRARNEATKEVRKAKKGYEKKLAEDIKNDPKSFWKYVRSKTKVKQGVNDLTRDDGTTAHTNEEKADVLNKFFCSVFTIENDENIPEPEMKYDGDALNDVVVTEEDVRKKLSKLNPSKSSGPDGLHPRVLKEVADEIVTPLTLIFNKTLREGVIPEEWKIANVTALFKKGNVASPGNYRPVSLTSVVCKLLESIIRDNVMDFLEENRLLSEDQHGFRSGRSCVTQLLEIMEIWTSMLDEGGGLDVVYLDFRKAFDSVPHQRLLKKIRAYGIDGSLLKWIESFLTGRKQRVIVNGGISAWSEVHSGIPQGSVLGPILFIIFINDLPDAVTNMVKIFADDTKLFTHVTNHQDRTNLQQDLDNLSNWSDMWQLKFNVAKCGVMYYGNQQEKHTYTMSEDGVQRNLGEVTEEKDLGVKFDPSLMFSKHIAMISKKANMMAGIVKRTFDHMDESMFITLYKTMIRPHVEYANCIWHPVLKKDSDLIEKVQRRATKLVPNLKDLSYRERLENLNLPTLAYRRLRGDLIQTYKIMQGLNNVQKEAIFRLAEPDSVTRGHRFKLAKQHSRLKLRQNSLGIRIVNTWNNLPDSIVAAKTVNIFKNGIDKVLAKDCDKFNYGMGCAWQTNF